MLLGKLIEQLESAPDRSHVTLSDGTVPIPDVFSYRGFYEDLAFAAGPAGETKPVTAKQFARTLRRAVGKKFTGYKGGSFTMGEHTRVWVSPYGEVGNVGIISVDYTDDGVVLTVVDIGDYSW